MRLDGSVNLWLLFCQTEARLMEGCLQGVCSTLSNQGTNDSVELGVWFRQTEARMTDRCLCGSCFRFLSTWGTDASVARGFGYKPRHKWQVVWKGLLYRKSKGAWEITWSSNSFEWVIGAQRHILGKCTDIGNHFLIRLTIEGQVHKFECSVPKDVGSANHWRTETEVRFSFA